MSTITFFSIFLTLLPLISSSPYTYFPKSGERWSDTTLLLQIGDCNSSPETLIGTANSVDDCTNKCKEEFGEENCLYITFDASGLGNCYREQDCVTHSASTAWKGYIVQYEPIFLHHGDCNTGSETRLSNANSVMECQTICRLRFGDDCVYFTLSTTGSGACYREESCGIPRTNTAWKGYMVQVPPTYLHIGDCTSGTQTKVGTA
eukprot:UN13058